MPVERRGEKWVARVPHGGCRYLVGVFGSETAARTALSEAEAAIVNGTSTLVGPPGTISGQAFANDLGVRYGTVRRWTHEGMPATWRGRAVHIDPIAARGWVEVHRKDSIAIDRTSLIYIARRETDGAFKIGWSSDVGRRLLELRKDTNSEVELVAAFPGDKPDEIRLHERFAKHRLDGEWFASSSGIGVLVARLCGAAA